MWKWRVYEMPWRYETSTGSFSISVGFVVAKSGLETSCRRIISPCWYLKDGKTNVRTLRNARKEEEIISDFFIFSYLSISYFSLDNSCEYKNLNIN